MKCKECNEEFNGKIKRSFLGFYKFTCRNCKTKNVGALGKISIICYIVAASVMYTLNIYDIMEFRTLPVISTLIENTLRGVYPWVILLSVPLFLHFKRKKNIIFQLLIVIIVLGTPISFALLGEYAISSVKKLIFKANTENYALSKNMQILNTLLQNPNIRDADAIKLVAESTNETYDIMKNYAQLRSQLIFPNSQFKNVYMFLYNKEEQAKTINKVFSNISVGKFDSLQIDLNLINDYQISATNALKSK